VEIRHDIGSTYPEHVVIHDLKLGYRWVEDNRDFQFSVRTQNPYWLHENDMSASTEHLANLKRHGENLLQALMRLAKPASDSRRQVDLDGRNFSFLYGNLAGRYVSTGPCATGGLSTHLRYWLRESKKGRRA
jgi:hypothetical protein